jgi:ectoine hydroxylase-related dioxygenase (phytanoyl-CoA dioxygenase family)
VLVAQSNQLFPDHYLKEPFYKDRIVELKGDDWMEIPHDDDDVFQDETKILSCALGPGDLLLWDSRTVHCSYPAESDSNDHKVVVGDENLRSVANGLIRAATLVSMMPTDRATQSVLEQRREAVDSSRTLTHWANKVAPLGEEREELVAVESSCVAAMKKLPGPKVLLEFGDLSEAQRNLVVGNRYMTPSKD